MSDEVFIISDSDEIKEFLKYDQRELTEDEKKSLSEAYEYYISMKGKIMEDMKIQLLFENLNKQIAEIKDQTLQNCGKLDKMSDKLSDIDKRLDGHSLTEIFDICQANGQGIEVMSQRLDKMSPNS